MITLDPKTLQQVFDLLPIPLMIVNRNVEIQEYNVAARKLIGKSDNVLLNLPDLRGGTALSCININNPGGCGCHDACKKCVIRNSVNESFNNHNVFQRETVIHIYFNEELKHVNALITVININEEQSMLVIENITNYVELQQLIPVCSHCKSVRNDDSYWSNVEDFIERTSGYDVTSGICPTCLKELYPELTEEQLQKLKGKY